METNLYALSLSLGNLCLAKKIKIAVAESCAGGMLAANLTAVSGSSAWFEGGVVAYSNTVKTSLLAVSQAVLEKHGAVSEAVAKAMAQGLLEKISADYAVSITGVAGPTGGAAEKPVGLVCFGLADKKHGTVETQTLQLESGRNAIRIAACSFAISWLIKHISV